MKLKGIIYILMISIFIISGCGNIETSHNNSDKPTTENSNEKVAMLIQKSDIKSTSSLNQKQSISPSISFRKTMIETLKEDAEDGTSSRWTIYDKSSNDTAISNVFDEEKQSRVIQFQGNGLNSGFAIGAWTSTGAWRDTQNKIIQWSMKFNENYMLYVRVSTLKGYRYLYYTSSDYNWGISSYDNPHYIHHGLGSNSNDGRWQTFTRDLSADLKGFEPDNTITSVDGFYVRGSGRVDDIALLKEDNNDTPTQPTIALIDPMTINDTTVLVKSYNGFELYDVSTPQTPTLLSSYDISESRTCSAYLLSENKQHLFIHSWQIAHGCDKHFANLLPFQIVDISDLSNPILKATTTLSRDYYSNFDVKWEHLGKNIYLITAMEELAIYDLTNYTKVGSFADRRSVKTTISADGTKLYVLHAGTYRFTLAADTFSVLNLTDLSVSQEYPYAVRQGLGIFGPDFTDFKLLENETKVKLTNSKGESKIIDL